LTAELHAKQSEIDHLRLQISQNSLKGTNDIYLLEKEITNLRDIEVVQGQENLEMINLKSAEELEKFNLQQSESHLRAKEVELL